MSNASLKVISQLFAALRVILTIFPDSERFTGCVYPRPWEACAVERYYMATGNAIGILKKFEHPKKKNTEMLDTMVRELLERRFLIDYEDYIMSIVTTPWLGRELRKKSPGTG